MQSTPSLRRRLLAEFLGSLLLAAVVVGSGIAAQRLSPGQPGLELLENAAATAAGLYVLILTLAPISGAHFNPLVSAVAARLDLLARGDAPFYVAAQLAGCVAGAALANTMFGSALISISAHHRAAAPHLLAEVVASAGLVLVIFGLIRAGRAANVPAAVAAYIASAYFFTSSTSFANPAITAGRVFSNSFAGIAPSSVAAFMVAQSIGAGLGLICVQLLHPKSIVTENHPHEHSPLRLPSERRTLADEPGAL